MGAEAFATKSRGASAQAAFISARTEAEYLHGHGGYTGTIAEKGEFKMVTLPPGMGAETFVERVLNDGYYPRTEELDESTQRAIAAASKIADDKWGPAACIEVPGSEDAGTREYVFFGWASS